eukprot:TRINITY_DN2938_c0_g1_i11.p1 TRINITY_DN2938_c0_g1~~TRINITY_DN2938_c0_g1_i11.p1  ORF type:complete len:793 (-),score=44.46 TRINITY_DN2938_c0_g1_i11:198-2576(-)
MQVQEQKSCLQLLTQGVSNKYEDKLVGYEHLLHLAQQENQSHPSAGGFLNQLQSYQYGDRENEQSFLQQFVQECARIREILSQSAKKLWLDMVHMAEELPSLEDGFVSEDLLFRIPKYRSICNEIGEQLVELESFISTNIKMLTRIAWVKDFNEFDEEIFEQDNDPYVQSVSNAILGNICLETILVGLSDTYVHLDKLVKAGHINKDDKWVAPDRFQRQTTKFWVHPDNVLKVKSIIIQHLPVLIYGDRPKLQFGRSNSAIRNLLEDNIGASAKISSVYVDNVDLYTYHQRLVREDGATLARIRWYGERQSGPFQKLYVERKLHREFWTGEFSMKERSPVKQGNIQAYMSGSPAVPELHDHNDSAGADLLSEIQDFIVEHNQQPMLRTQYFRTAFQHPTDNLVRVSLDSDVRMIRELNSPKLAGDWCRDTVTCPLPREDLVKFPYAIVEVKLQDSAPDWVRGLIETGLLVAVPKFSKFLHGMALLFGDKVQSAPYWFLPDLSQNQSYLTPATLEEMADTYDPYMDKGSFWFWPEMPKEAFAIGNPPEVLEVDANDFIELPRASHPSNIKINSALPNQSRAFQSVDSPFKNQSQQQSGKHQLQDQGEWSIEMQSIAKDNGENKTSQNKIVDHDEIPQMLKEKQFTPIECKHKQVKVGKVMIRTRVEPKVFFANERTFLSWMSIAVLLMFVALSLMDSYRYNGLGFSSGMGMGGIPNCDDDSLRCRVGLISGAVIAPVSIMIMGYALFVYRKRTFQMLKRETSRYDDQLGPLLLAIILICVMMLAYTISLVVAF